MSIILQSIVPNIINDKRKGSRESGVAETELELEHFLLTEEWQMTNTDESKIEWTDKLRV